jgi:hypothetical protein
VIDRAREHPLELGRAHPRGKAGNLRGRLGDGCVVLFGGPQLEQYRGVVDVARELLDGAELLLDARSPAIDRLSFLPVVPEAGR